LQQCVAKLEHEGLDVLAHAVDQKKELMRLKSTINDIKKDNILLYTRAKESAKQVKDLEKVIKVLSTELE
jgi:uncharacterized UPF0146 family protein